MSDQPDGRESMPRSTWIRFVVFGLVLLAGFVAIRWTTVGELFTEDRVVSLLTQVRSVWWSPLVLVILYTVLAPVGMPMVPLLLGGAVFGPVFGAAYNTIGLLLGAVASYFLARWLGRDFVFQITGDRLRRAERAFDRHGFWPLVQTRFLPLPFPLVNFGAALAGVRPAKFVIATVIGVLPSTLVHTYFMARLISSSGTDRIHIGGAYLGTFVACNLLIALPWMREQLKRRRRYRELLAARATRAIEINPDTREP